MKMNINNKMDRYQNQHILKNKKNIWLVIYHNIWIKIKILIQMTQKKVLSILNLNLFQN